MYTWAFARKFCSKNYKFFEKKYFSRKKHNFTKILLDA